MKDFEKARLHYDELKRELEGAPVTWVPALLRAIVERAISSKVFVDGGLARFVQIVIDRAAK